MAHYSPPYPYFTNQICRRGILTESFRLIDVGVRGGIHDRWQAFGDHLEAWGFDALYEDGVAPLIAANKHPDRIRYLHLALGDKDEVRPFRYYPENPSSSHFAATNGTDVIDEHWTEVPIRRLDTLIAQGTVDPAIDFMKLDAETYEIEIIKGAGEMLSHSGILGIESEASFFRTGRNPRSHFVELYEQLAPYGMTVYDLGIVRHPKPTVLKGFPQEIVGGRYAMRPIGRLHVCDCLFLDNAFEDAATQATRSVNRLLKMIAIAELYGLQDISLAILFDNKSLLSDRLDVDEASGWLMREHPNQTFTYQQYIESGIKAIPFDLNVDPRRAAENLVYKVVTQDAVSISPSHDTAIEPTGQCSTALTPDFTSRRQVFATHVVAKTENNCLFLLGGNDFYNLIFDVSTNYDDGFSCVVVNIDSRRCKRVVLDGTVHYRLWPHQFMRVIRCGSMWLTDPPAQRWKLPNSRTIYVAPDGNDAANDGMVPASPLRTPQLAANLIIDQFDINGADAEIRLLDGVYNVPPGGQLINVSKPLHGKNKFDVQGNLDDPDSVVINIPARSRGFYVEDFGILVVMGMRLATSGLGSVGLFVRQFGIGDLGWVHFGAFEQSNPVMTWNGSVNVIGPVRFDGNAHFMFAANRGGEIDFGSQNIEFADGLSATRVLHAESGGRIHAQYATWSAIGGGAPPILAGQKALADGQGSQISANAAAMPGTAKQATSNGGQFFQIPPEPDQEISGARNDATSQAANDRAAKSSLLSRLARKTRSLRFGSPG